MTFLLGPNNSGKSSILAAIRLLAQTEISADSRVPLLLEGPLGDFGTYRDIVFGNHRGRPFRIGISGHRHGLARRRSRRRGGFQLEVEFKFRPRRRQLILRETELADEEGHLITASYVPDSDRHVITKLAGRPVESQFRASSAEYLRLDHFIPALFPGLWSTDEETFLGRKFTRDDLRQLSVRMDGARLALRDELGAFEYVGSMRAPPERTYHQTGEARSRVGAEGENWAGLLVLDSSRGGSGSREIRAGLNGWLKAAGLASEVSLNWLSDRHYEVLVRHPVTGEKENLADVGQANSQIIPVLVGGLRLDQGDSYMVEEPEIHLHPRAQADLGDFFVDLHNRGVAQIIETHSEYLLLRIQQHVADGEVDPSNVAFYYVYSDPKTGTKEVKLLTLDEDARFEQSLDGGFFPQRLEEARKLAKLRSD